MFLAFAQPLVRGWSRYFTWLQFKRTPELRHRRARAACLPAPISAAACGAAIIGAKRARIAITSSARSLALLEEEGWRYSTDTGWNDWDIHIYGNFWWSIALQTVTEYHGGAKCLTRVGLPQPLRRDDGHHQSRGADAAHLPPAQHRQHRLVGARCPIFAFVAFLAFRARQLKAASPSWSTSRRIASDCNGSRRTRRGRNRRRRVAADAGWRSCFTLRPMRSSLRVRVLLRARRWRLCSAPRSICFDDWTLAGNAGALCRLRRCLRASRFSFAVSRFPDKHQPSRAGDRSSGASRSLCGSSSCRSNRATISGVTNGRAKFSRLASIPTCRRQTILR